MGIDIKKIELGSLKTERLPVWFNFIIYNDLINHEGEYLDGKENPNLGGYHIYNSSSKPISKIIDYKKINFDELK